MCGILGALHFDGKPINKNKLKQSAQWMKHRGPDDEGVWIDGAFGLAHKRLAILDLSSAGRQPMVSADGSVVICYNGECYNFQSLRCDLKSKGYQFRSKTDTEVILYGMREYGPDFVKKMNGMFAFAIWFKNEKELFIFRDRLGIKPLYFYNDSTKFYFSSEIKPLLSLGIHPELESSMVSAFFSLRYCPGEQTLFKGIMKLSAGHYLKVRMDASVEEKQYWSLLDCNKFDVISESQAQDKFFELLDDAVKMRQIADVPVGAFLSGGIDSSAIAALMKRNSSKVTTFTFGMGADIDETSTATRVANYLKVDNTILSLKKDDYQFYSKALWHLEEPLGDSIIAPTYRLAQRASQDVKVVELGEGADEILGGYVHQLAMTYGNILGNLIPGFIRKSLPKAARMLPQFFWEKMFPYPAQLGKSGINKISDYLAQIDSPAMAYLELVGVFKETEKKQIFNAQFYQEFVTNRNSSKIFSNFLSHSTNSVFQNRLLQMDLKFWNTDYTMLRMDKLTMAHSLEARVPFLDHRLVEFCLGLPRKYCTKNFKQKLLFRNAVAKNNLLPTDIVKAPKKSFYLPIEKCYDVRFEEFLRDTLSEHSLRQRGIFNVKFIQNFLNLSSRELIVNKQIMLLLAFELWAKLFLDGDWKTEKC